MRFYKGDENIYIDVKDDTGKAVGGNVNRFRKVEKTMAKFNPGDKVKVNYQPYFNPKETYVVREVEQGIVSFVGHPYVAYLNQITLIRRTTMDKTTEPNVITLNNKQYVVENISGKGECLVPYVKPAITWSEVIGKVVKRKNFDTYRLVFKNPGDGAICIIDVSSDRRQCGMSRDNYPNGSCRVPDDYEVVADSVADAVRKGLIK